MTEFTERTVFPLGGNVTVTAAASISANGNLTVASPLKFLGGGSSLSSDTSMTIVVVGTTRATATLSLGSTCISDQGIAIRLGHSNLSASMSLDASGSAIYTASGAALGADLDVEASGGKTLDADAPAFEPSLTVSITNPGLLFDGGEVGMAADIGLDTTVAPVFRLVLPTRRQSFSRHPLFSRYLIDTGVTMLVTGGAVQLIESPSDTELKACDRYYLGGYRHQITPAERAVIVAAGYGDLIEEA